jgi:predicted nucleotidyltransferase
MRVRDKDYIITKDRLIFVVVGYTHGERAVANLKYVPKGDSYRKIKYYSVKDYCKALSFLKREYPHYVDYDKSSGAEVSSVSEVDVLEVLRPQERFELMLQKSQRDPLEDKAVELAKLLSKECSIPLKAFGVTDSLLWGGYMRDSDIDLVVYGKTFVGSLRGGVERLLGEGRITPIPKRRFKVSRSQKPLIPRRWNLGIFNGTRFSLRGVRDWSEIVHSLATCKGLGVKRMELEVLDDSESLFYPVVYRVKGGVRELVSYTTFYEGMFKAGDQVAVTAKVEEAEDRGDYRRMVLGSLEASGRERVTLEGL